MYRVPGTVLGVGGWYWFGEDSKGLLAWNYVVLLEETEDHGTIQ